MSIKKNVHSFRIANKTYRLVKEFNKHFLEELAEESLDTKLKMYSMCIRYMQESLNKKFEIK